MFPFLTHIVNFSDLTSNLSQSWCKPSFDDVGSIHVIKESRLFQRGNIGKIMNI